MNHLSKDSQEVGGIANQHIAGVCNRMSVLDIKDSAEAC